MAIVYREKTANGITTREYMHGRGVAMCWRSVKRGALRMTGVAAGLWLFHYDKTPETDSARNVINFTYGVEGC